MKIDSQIHDLIEPSICAMGVDLWGVELCRAGAHSVLRVYIDSPSGITLDLCADISHQISAVLDVEDIIKSKYSLEVSSPGMDRKLFKPSQYKDYIGKTIQLVLSAPKNGRRKFKGDLQSADAEGVKLSFENKEESFSFFEIDSANICINSEDL
jgi:ribosome maturation factor RimP